MKSSFKSIVILLFASALMAVITSSCGTVRGFGSDVGTVGNGIRNSAR